MSTKETDPTPIIAEERSYWHELDLIGWKVYGWDYKDSCSYFDSSGRKFDLTGTQHDDIVKALAAEQSRRESAELERDEALQKCLSAETCSTLSKERISRLAAKLVDAGNLCERQIMRIRTLQSVCGEAYQLAGTVGAPVKALDNLSAAANGEPIPHETFLPVTDLDCSRISELTAQLEQLTASEQRMWVARDEAVEKSIAAELALARMREVVEREGVHAIRCAWHQVTVGIYGEVFFTLTGKPCDCWRSRLLASLPLPVSGLADAARAAVESWQKKWRGSPGEDIMNALDALAAAWGKV